MAFSILSYCPHSSLISPLPILRQINRSHFPVPTTPPSPNVRSNTQTLNTLTSTLLSFFPRQVNQPSRIFYLMASNSFQSLRHQYHHQTTSCSRGRRHSLDSSAPSFLSSSIFSKPATTNTKNSITTFSISSSSITTFQTKNSSATTQPPGTTSTISFDSLKKHLSEQNFREADEETRRLLIILAGEAAEKRGYVFFSEVQFISEDDLKTIDALWRKYSDNKFGYSVQKRIWGKVNKDFTRFFLKVGWMKKLDTEIEQYNYKSFPDDFLWEMTKDTPEGHLPLTNALRGTQLLNCILSHPAFQDMEDEQVEAERQGAGGVEEGGERTEKARDRGNTNPKPLSKGLFKPDYSF